MTDRPLLTPPPRKRPDVKDLLKKNRATPNEESPADKTPKPLAHDDMLEPEPVTPPEPPLSTVKKEAVALYMTERNKAVARAAFAATSGLEDDESWSHFVEKAVMMEVRRRERIYNDGKEWPPRRSGKRFSPGGKVRG